MQGTGLDLGLVQCLDLEGEDGVGPHRHQYLLHLHPEEQDKGNLVGLRCPLHLHLEGEDRVDPGGLHLEGEDRVDPGGLHLEGQGGVGHPLLQLLLNLLELNKGNSLDNVAIRNVPSFENYKA